MKQHSPDLPWQAPAGDRPRRHCRPRPRRRRRPHPPRRHQPRSRRRGQPPPRRPRTNEVLTTLETEATVIGAAFPSYNNAFDDTELYTLFGQSAF